MIQVNRIYLIFNRLVTKKFLVDTSDMANVEKTYLLNLFCFSQFDKASTKSSETCFKLCVCITS